MSASSGLSPATTQKIVDILQKWPEIDKVILYGSRAMGSYREGSDIDLSIISNSLTFDQLLQITGQLDDLLLPYKIDISIFSQIENPSLIDHIQRVGKIFYQR